MNALRIGVVGFGAIGRHHARVLRAMDGVDLVGVVDADPGSRAQADEAGFPVLETIDELLALRIDAAIVAVPTVRHEEVAEALIESGCALLVEKPLAGTLSAAKRIIARASKASCRLMVGYIERYNPAVEAICDFIAAGNLGKVLSVTARRVGVLPPRIKDANVIVDIGVHDIDLVAFITGARLTLLSAQGGMAFLDDRVDYATLLLDAEGCVVSIEANWVTPVKVREMVLTGTRGVCRVDYITQKAEFAPGRSFEPTSTYEALVDQYLEGTMVALPVARREPLARELEVFVAGVRGAPLPDPSIALASLRIAEEATGAINRVRLMRASTLRPA